MIFRIAALEPGRPPLAFKGENVRGYAVKEPTVVGDDHHAAAEFLQTFFERAERPDIEIVRRFVQKKEIAAAREKLGEVHAVAFAAGKNPDLLLLLGAAEIEAAAVGAAVHHRRAGEIHEFAAAGDRLVDGLVGFELAARLIDVREFDRLADLKFAGERLELAGYELEERRLARAVGADHPDYAAARQIEIEIVVKNLTVESHLDVFGADDEISEPRPRRDADDEIVFARRDLLLLQFFVALDTRLGLGVAA